LEHLLPLEIITTMICAMKNLKSDRSAFVAPVKFLILGLLLLSFGSSQHVEATPISVSFQVFYDELSPFGDWIDDPHYGYVWVPRVDQNFQPYRSNGHWVMSTYGNTWVSQYDWGWAPFHYGRWFFSDFYGWAWIPGYEWGPAWVNWRSGRGYYGWLPLGPQTYFYTSARYPIYSRWVFVPRRRLLSRNVYRYYLPGRNVNVIYNQTTIINNNYVHNNNTYVSGPSRSELQQVTRRNVPVFEVTQGRRPGRTSINKNSISLYKPEISRSRTTSRNDESSRPRNYMSTSEFGNARSTVTRPGNGGSTSSATSPRSASVRAETLRNSTAPDSRSARSSVNTNPGVRSTQQQSVSPSVSSRSNGSIGNTSSRSRSNYTSPNNGIQQRAVPSPSRPDSRKITPNYSETRRSSTSAYQRNNSTPTQQRALKQRAPVQKQIRKSTPLGSSTNTRRIAPSTRQNSSVQRAPQRSNTRINSNSSSRSQTRSAPSPQRSQRSSTTRSTRSDRRN
jgi:hypothetical protein